MSTASALPAEWNPNANNTGRALAFNGSEIIAGGDWNLIGPRERGGWARFGLAPANQTLTYKTAARAISGATAANVYAAVISGTALYIGGDFLSINYSTTRNRIAAVSTTTGVATSFDTNMNNVVRALTLDSANNLLYAGGDFTTVNGGTTRNRLAALSTSTSVANAFDPNMSNQVHALALDTTNSLVYAGGTFTTVNGATTRNGLAVLGAADGTATSWDPNVSNTVRALALDPAAGLLYAGGDFITVNGATTRNRLAAIATSTATATSWNGNANIVVYALALDGGGLLYADGQFTTVNGATTRNRAASLSTATATASSWNPNLNTSAWSLGISVPSKRIALGGVFTTAGGLSRLSLATYGP